MILVVTRKNDVHGAHIVELLKNKGENVIAFDYSHFPSETEITFWKNKNKEEVIISFGKDTVIRANEIKSVLNRRQDEPKPGKGIKGKGIKEYITRESRNFLDVLPGIIKSPWISDPDMVRMASRKPHQLQVASELGFTIPDTLVTNSPIEAKRFIMGAYSDFAVKTLWTAGISTEGRGILLYTKKISRRQILNTLQNIKNCPMIFQPYIEKKLELRITMVGEKVFACAIHSQQSARAKEDWRRYDLINTPHEPYELSPQISRKCITLCKRLGLMFGCIDMIITPSGKYIFLEINPSGQWLWIEKLTGMPISEAITNLLINPTK